MAFDIAGPAGGVFFAGNDLELVFTVTIDGAVVDISNAIARFAMSRTWGSSLVISTEPPLSNAMATLTDETNGEFTVTIDGVDTSALFGTYMYQAQVEDAAGDRTNVLHGWFTFKENIIPEDSTA